MSDPAATRPAIATQATPNDRSLDWAQVFRDERCALTSLDYARQRAELLPEVPFAAGSVHANFETEVESLRTRLLGIALSGGGIRSASFALGVLQAMLRFDIVERFHYLSTVSGGGYMGLSLAWLRKRYGQHWKQHLFRIESGARVHLADKSAEPPPAPVSAQFGVNAPAQTAAQTTASSDKTSTSNTSVPESDQPVWLDYIRQHGNFLQPPDMSTLALVGAALRNSVVSAALYFLMVALALAGLIRVGVVGTNAGFAPGSACLLTTSGHPFLCYDAPSLLALTASAIVVLFVGYSVGSFVLSLKRIGRVLGAVFATAAFGGVLWLAWKHETTTGIARLSVSAVTLPALAAIALGLRLLWDALCPQKADTRNYQMRLDLQRLTGLLCGLLMLFAVLAILPWAYFKLQREGSLSIAAVASVGALYQAFWARSRYLPRSVMTHVRLLITAGLVLAAAALLAFRLAFALVVDFPVANSSLYLATAAVLIVAFCTNLNQFGLSRMYRDRLMEAFMPNLSSIRSQQWEMATEADGDEFGPLQKLWPPDLPTAAEALSLYPLINTNVVLVDSKSDAYRSRGGDCFVLTPGACGSDATRWVETRHFADGELSAATAMAASGAAANPNTGSGGRGITRNRLVSFLMFLMQARLGIWVRNPYLNQQGLASKTRKFLLEQRPNFIFPGVLSGLFGRGLSEKSYFLELTDGGHFDNTGAYELIRRRARLIVLAQASQDGTNGLADLANFTEKVRVDFGVHLRFDDGICLEKLVPPQAAHKYDRPCADRGHAVARILYPKSEGQLEMCGWLVYLHATPVHNLPVDVQSYRHHDKNFPHQSTGDQFFDEAQLEAYRELGYAIAKRFFVDVLSAQAAPHGPSYHRGTALSDIRHLLDPQPFKSRSLDSLE